MPVSTKRPPAAVNGAQAITRSIHVLRVVAQLQRTGATTTKVTAATGLSRPTAIRILQALVAERMLRRAEDGRCYVLGPLAFELGLAVPTPRPAHSRWQAIVDEVARRTRLTSYLMGRSGNEAVCLICTQGAAAIRAMPVEVGQRVPLGIGAGSLAILASLPDEAITQIVEQRGQQGTVFPIGHELTSDLWDRIAQTRADGFSTSRGTVAKGVSGVGVLVPQRHGNEPLAITVSAAVDDLLPLEARRLAHEIAQIVASQRDHSKLAGRISM